MILFKARDTRRRIEGLYQRKKAHLYAKRTILWSSQKPVISFTFDDFPKSAYRVGGQILQNHECLGTYFASFGLMGKYSPSGELFTLTDLDDLLAEGHEVGCHTYGHLDSWQSTPRSFEESIIKNREAMRATFPGYALRTMAYPLTEPHPCIKRVAQEYFACCRGGGRMINVGRIDLNLLKSFFIDKKTRDNQNYFKEIIEKNKKINGWLIFSTHDIAESPSDYGCRPDTFEFIVRNAVDSSAIILPIGEVYSRIGKKTCIP